MSGVTSPNYLIPTPGSTSRVQAIGIAGLAGFQDVGSRNHTCLATGQFLFVPGTDMTASPDAGFSRPAVNTIQCTNGSTGGSIFKIGDSATPIVGINNTNTGLLIVGDNQLSTRHVQSGAGGTPAATYIYKSRGTNAAPTAVTTGDYIWSLQGYAYGGATSGYGQHGYIDVRVAGVPNDGAATYTGRLVLGTNNNGIGAIDRVALEPTGSLIQNYTGVALATYATDGFMYVASCAGTPSGAPTAYTGAVPIVVDTTNNVLYFRSGGAWQKSSQGGGTIVAYGDTVGATAQVASCATYTPGSDGTFRIDCNLLVTEATTHSFTAEVSYKSEDGTARVLTLSYTLLAGGALGTLVINANGTVPYEYVSTTIRAAAGTAIIVRTNAAGTYTATAFNMRAAITQLS